MTHKRFVSIQPLRVVKDAKGKEIEVRRGGTVDKNKYAKLTPREREIMANIDNEDYKPGGER